MPSVIRNVQDISILSKNEFFLFYKIVKYDNLSVIYNDIKRVVSAYMLMKWTNNVCGQYPLSGQSQTEN